MTDTDPRPVAAYLRCSTDHQDTASQRDAIARWAGGRPVEWFEDKALSGSLRSRPAWDALWGGALDGRYSAVVAAEMSRIGRSVIHLIDIFAQARDKGIALVLLREHVDLSTPSGRLMANLMASVAEFERERLAERVRAGVRTFRAEHGEDAPWGGARAAVGSSGGPKLLAAERRMLERELLDGQSPTALAHRYGLTVGRVRQIKGRLTERAAPSP